MKLDLILVIGRYLDIISNFQFYIDIVSMKHFSRSVEHKT